jgi:cytochrome c553
MGPHRFARCLLLVLTLSPFACARGAEALTRQVPDTIAQRAQACTVCHGKEGRATNDGYFPRIAGKPAGYLFNQLLNFREGRRTNGAMTYLIDHLSDAYLREIAEYFSGLDLPYPPAQTTGAPKKQLERAAALVRDGDAQRRIPACVQCHGSAMTGVAPAIPGLLGLPRDYLIGQLGAWKTHERHAARPDCMGQIAGLLSDEDIGALATWLSSQTLPASTRPAATIALPQPRDCGSGLH